MVIVERPCCEAPIAVTFPLAEILRCEDCAVTWTVVDAGPAPLPLAQRDAPALAT